MRKSSFGRYLTSFKAAFRDYVFRALLFLTLAVLAVGFSRDRADQKQINEARQNTQSEREKADDRIADYTWWLTFFTAVLGIGSLSQIAFLINADKTARLAAEAAKTSADSLQVTERAYVSEALIDESISGTLAGLDYKNRFSPFHTTENIRVRFKFDNFGKTPATIISFTGEILIAETLVEIEPSKFSEHVRSREALNKYTLAPSDYTDTLAIERAFDFTSASVADFMRRKNFIWFMGHVVWDDILGGRNIRMFIWQYDIGVRGFKPFKIQFDRRMKTENE